MIHDDVWVFSLVNHSADLPNPRCPVECCTDTPVWGLARPTPQGWCRLDILCNRHFRAGFGVVVGLSRDIAQQIAARAGEGGGE